MTLSNHSKVSVYWILHSLLYFIAFLEHPLTYEIVLTMCVTYKVRDSGSKIQVQVASFASHHLS